MKYFDFPPFPMLFLVCLVHSVMGFSACAQMGDGTADGRRRNAPPPAEGGALQWVRPPVFGVRLQYRTFESKAAGSKVSYLIYTPSEYESSKNVRYPVMYWLHGIGGGQMGVPDMTRRFDDAIRAGKTPPMLVVFVNGLADSMWCDSKDGKRPVETVFIKELIPHIDASYRTIATREGRLIEGFSMGGFGAARLGFKYPGLFGTVSMLSGALHDENSFKERHGALFQSLFGGDSDYFNAQSPWTWAQKNAGTLQTKTPVRLVVGDHDITLGHNRDFDAWFGKLGIPHTFTVLSCVGHSPGPVYEGLGEENWKFYSKVFAPNEASVKAGRAGERL